MSRKPVSTERKQEITSHKEPDGTNVKQIKTIYIDHYADGSTRTRTEVETIKERLVRVEVPWSPAELKVPNYAWKTQLETKLDDDFCLACLEAHNDLRARHNSPPLILDNQMSQVAQAWANHHAQINKSTTGRMVHSNWGFGENIYWKSGHLMNGRTAAEGWYSEIEMFNWNNIDDQKGTGHFTQLIWKDSKKLGVAKAYSKKGDTYVVCTYAPPGNIRTKFPLNVLPLRPGVPERYRASRQVSRAQSVRPSVAQSERSMRSTVPPGPSIQSLRSNASNRPSNAPSRRSSVQSIRLSHQAPKSAGTGVGGGKPKTPEQKRKSQDQKKKSTDQQPSAKPSTTHRPSNPDKNDGKKLSGGGGSSEKAKSLELPKDPSEEDEEYTKKSHSI